MSGPDRIERESALLGADHEPPAHWESRVFAAIADERIEGALARLGEEHEPPAGWQVRVLAATADRPKRRSWWLAAPVFALAAAVVAIVASDGQSPRQALVLAVSTERTGEVTRGAATGEHRAIVAVDVGDIAHATVHGGGPFRALWIYHNDHELVLACPGDDRCRSSESQIDVAVKLESIGLYQLVALSSSLPIAPPLGSYDHAIAAAQRAGGTPETRILRAR